MSFKLRLLQVFILCFFLGSVQGFQDSKQAQVKKWIDELGDADFTTRENAHKNLWKTGSDAEEQLKVALKGNDAEIRKRSLELLEKFKWGIYHDSPIAIIDLIQAYQSGKYRVFLEVQATTLFHRVYVHLNYVLLGRQRGPLLE